MLFPNIHVWYIDIYIWMHTYMQLERIEDKFLGHNANLVDLNTLTAPPSSKPQSLNPFSTVPSQHTSVSPFDVNKPPAPTLHQLAATSQGYPLASKCEQERMLPQLHSQPEGLN